MIDRTRQRAAHYLASAIDGEAGEPLREGHFSRRHVRDSAPDHFHHQVLEMGGVSGDNRILSGCQGIRRP